MIAVDTSSLVAYLKGQTGEDVQSLDQALEMKQIVLPPVVLTEILSDTKILAEVAELLESLPVLDVSDGFWQRAGFSRSKVLSKGFKARIADALIAQSCLDHKVAIITRDHDFKAFSKVCGLKLI